MREIYASPRHENVDRVVALLAEHGIETRVNNRSAYQRPSYNRFSYSAPGDANRWPQVEVRFAKDMPQARALLREAGLEPMTRHAEVLAASRADNATARMQARRKATVRRVRMMMFAGIGAILALMVLQAAGLL